MLTPSSPALLAYDYIITLDGEVKLFWKRKFNVASILFGANRYLAFVPIMLRLPYYIPPDSLTNTVSVTHSSPHGFRALMMLCYTAQA